MQHHTLRWSRSCASAPAPDDGLQEGAAEASGDIEKAIDVLRKKGMAKAAKKAGRATTEGAVGSYIHAGGKIGVLVEVNCETDFVARTDDFQALVRDIAMHIAAADPRFVRREEVTDDVLERERDDLPRAGRSRRASRRRWSRRSSRARWRSSTARPCCSSSRSSRTPTRRSATWSTQKVAKIGENIQVRRFARFKLGEGIEKTERRLRRRGGGAGRPARLRSPMDQPAYRRILLKLSGEALMGSQPFGIDEAVVAAIADELREVYGRERAGRHRHRRRQHHPRPRRSATAASTASPATTWACWRTVINALALQDALEKRGVDTRVQSRDRHPRGGRALHPPPRHPPPGERAAW